MLAAARDHGYAPEGVLVQRMAGGGTELLLGIAGDPRFGPLVALAAGGATAELVRDVEVRLAPIGPEEAARMISGLRSFPLLDGFRGRPRGDIAALRDAVVRLGALAAGHPELAELDCDPLVAGPSGAVVVDARARLEQRPPSARTRRSGADRLNAPGPADAGPGRCQLSLRLSLRPQPSRRSARRAPWQARA